MPPSIKDLTWLSLNYSDYKLVTFHLPNCVDIIQKTCETQGPQGSYHQQQKLERGHSAYDAYNLPVTYHLLSPTHLLRKHCRVARLGGRQPEVTRHGSCALRRRWEPMFSWPWYCFKLGSRLYHLRLQLLQRYDLT